MVRSDDQLFKFLSRDVPTPLSAIQRFLNPIFPPPETDQVPYNFIFPNLSERINPPGLKPLWIIHTFPYLTPYLPHSALTVRSYSFSQRVTTFSNFHPSSRRFLNMIAWENPHPITSKTLKPLPPLWKPLPALSHPPPSRFFESCLFTLCSSHSPHDWFDMSGLIRISLLFKLPLPT